MTARNAAALPLKSGATGATGRESRWAGHINLMLSYSQGSRLGKALQQVQNSSCSGFSCWSESSLPPSLFSHQSSISFHREAVKDLTERNENFCTSFKSGLAKLLENIWQHNNPALTKGCLDIITGLSYLLLLRS